MSSESQVAGQQVQGNDVIGNIFEKMSVPFLNQRTSENKQSIDAVNADINIDDRAPTHNTMNNYVQNAGQTAENEGASTPNLAELKNIMQQQIDFCAQMCKMMQSSANEKECMPAASFQTGRKGEKTSGRNR